MPQQASGSAHGKVRPATVLSKKLDQKLVAYLAAAGAAGVGLTLAGQPAEAKVICTKANIIVNGLVPIDINGDGTTDFTIIRAIGGSNESFLNVSAPAGNGWFGSQAKPMFFGVPVGPGEKFGGSYAGLAAFSHYGSFSGSSGEWANKVNAYMGVRFKIGGTLHYGWIRMTVANKGATITGWAYETVPNASIRTGFVGGPSSLGQKAALLAPAKMPTALGALALGSNGLALWRREEEIAS